MIGVQRQGLLKGRLGAFEVALLESCLAKIKRVSRVVGRRYQNFSSPRCLTGSGKSR
jgi:hypothetical protein